MKAGEAEMNGNYAVVAEPYGRSLSLACDECGGLRFAVIWEIERSVNRERLPDRVAAVCDECAARKTLATR